MNEFEKFNELVITRLINVKTEEGRNLMLELMPQLENMTKKFFAERVSASDIQVEDIDWISELSEYIINTIRLYLRYHVSGELQHICLTLSEEDTPVINLTINQQDYLIDFDEFKNWTHENNRDDHRECYYRNESIWHEYRSTCNCDDIAPVGEGLCRKLKKAFPEATVEYVFS